MAVQKMRMNLPTAHFAEAQCTQCHTTGFAFAQDQKTRVWKAGGNGELGIGCERCHGPGVSMSRPRMPAE